MSQQKSDLTAVLKSLSSDSESINKALPLVYDELRSLAHHQLRGERWGHTLNTTALVHEAYIKLVNHPPVGDWDGRRHFFGIAARAMRQILVNYAKKKSRNKRGGKNEPLSFEDEIYISEEKAGDIIVLDKALKRLEKLNNRQSRVIECRYFAGYSIEETADILGVSSATVKRDWTIAKAWLYDQIHNKKT